jgi:hypothetical protein
MQRGVRILAGLCLAFVLAGCATPALTVSESQNKVRDSREARLYFIRPKTNTAMAVAPDVKINNQVVGAIPNGSYFFVDRPAGQYTIAIEQQIDFGRFEADIQIASGQTYYFEILSKPSYIPTGGGGVIVMQPRSVGTEAVKQRSLGGSFRLNTLDAVVAAAEMEKLKVVR